MKPTDNISRVIREKLNFTASAELHQRILADALAARPQSEESRSARGEPNIRRTIMKSRAARLAAAAVIIIVASVGVYQLAGLMDGAGVAYGITDSLSVCMKANTIHVRGWVFLKKTEDSDAEREMFPFEEWVDKTAGHFSEWRPKGFWGVDLVGPMYFLTVSDGRYLMKTFYQDSKYVAAFVELSPLEQRLQVHRLRVFGLDSIGPEHLNPQTFKGFAKIGEDKIDGEVFHIWEGQETDPGQSVPFIKHQVWLSPSSGRIARIFKWENTDTNTVRWRPAVEMHTIEYDMVPPADCFNTEAPADLKLVNTKETAEQSKAVLGEFGPFQRYYECIGFTLNDGSVILVWPALADSRQSEHSPFENLQPGCPLPQLLVQITSLAPWPVKEDISCVGYHLAHTVKAGKLYEWGIYVAKGRMPDRSSFICYNMAKNHFDTKVNSPDTLVVSEPLIEEVEIRSEQEFDMFVRGEMAELSDDGKAPDDLTYERVSHLAEQIRLSSGR